MYLVFIFSTTYSKSCKTVMDYLQSAKILRFFFENQSFKNVNFQTFEVLTVKLNSFGKKMTCKIGNCLILDFFTIQNLVKLLWNTCDVHQFHEIYWKLEKSFLNMPRFHISQILWLTSFAESLMDLFLLRVLTPLLANSSMTTQTSLNLFTFHRRNKTG